MLSTWLSPMTLTDFREQHFRRSPHAVPGSAKSVGSILDWNALGRILSVAAPADILTVAKGNVVDGPSPRSLADVKKLFAAGIGLTVRKVTRYDPALAALADAFVAELPGIIDLHVFVTPGGTHGYGWHYDIEHVFIVQTAGRKDYYFRRNTRVDHLPAEAQPDLSQFANERSPISTATLLPGDWLYLPARWWHVALCAEDSLSLSLGIVPAAR
jgi:50S ribosomal protein L16 3-hydroxylase